VRFLRTDRGCQPAPGLPCALFNQEGEDIGKPRAHRAARMHSHICCSKFESYHWLCALVPRTQRITTSAFTRVFDALWWCAAEPGPMLQSGSRLCAAALSRCSASGTRGLCSPDGIFPRLPRPRQHVRKTRQEETPAENELTIKGKAYIAGIYEHPTRHAPDKSTAQLHAEVAKGAIEDAGLSKQDIDGYFCAGDAPGGAWPMVDYLGLKVRHIDSTDTGGCSYLIHLGHAADVLDPILVGEAEITVEAVPDVIAVKQHGVVARAMQRLLDEVRNRRLSGAGEAGEPERESVVFLSHLWSSPFFSMCRSRRL